MASEFTVKREPKQWNAKIFSDNEEIAEVKKGEGLAFRLIRHKDNREWVLTNKIDGEHRRFSFSAQDIGNKKEENDDTVFTVRDHIFKHNGKHYMLACHPEGKSWQEYIDANVRYICRLDSFPFPNMTEGGVGSEKEAGRQHYHLRHKQKRFRGVPVGEMSGLAIEERGHRVKVDRELEDVGLFLAAISYLMHASA